MFKTNRIVSIFSGLLTYNRGSSDDMPNPDPNQTSTGIEIEPENSQIDETSSFLSTSKTVDEPLKFEKNTNNQMDPESDDIQDPTVKSESVKKAQEPKVFIVHALSDQNDAFKLGNKLIAEGCHVHLSALIQKDLVKENHRAALRGMQLAVDFVVFFMTDALYAQIFPQHPIHSTSTDFESKTNYYMYTLCCNEYFQAGCNNFRARAVCYSQEIENSKKIAQKIRSEQILMWSFQLWEEGNDGGWDNVSKLVANLKYTKENLLDTPLALVGRRELIQLSKDEYAKLKAKYECKEKRTVVDKIVLFIANQEYDSLHPLKAPINDVHQLAEIFYSMDFKVIVATNVTAKEMRSVIDGFCSLLVPDSYGVFFFAGHGLEKNGRTFLLPVDYKIPTVDYKEDEQETYIDRLEILKCMQERGTALNAFFLDCCRKELKTFGTIKEKIDVDVNKNTVYVFAAPSSKESYEQKENSFMTKSLKEHLHKDLDFPILIYEMQLSSDGESYFNPELRTLLTKRVKLCDPIRKRPDFCRWKIFSYGDGEPYFNPELNSLLTKRMKLCDPIRKRPNFCQEEDVQEALDCFTIVDFHDFKFKVIIGVSGANSDGSYFEVILETKENIISDNYEGSKINGKARLKLIPSEGFPLPEIFLKPNIPRALFYKNINIQVMQNQFLKGEIYFKVGSDSEQKYEFFIWMKWLSLSGYVPMKI